MGTRLAVMCIQKFQSSTNDQEHSNALCINSLLTDTSERRTPVGPCMPFFGHFTVSKLFIRRTPTTDSWYQSDSVHLRES